MKKFFLISTIILLSATLLTGCFGGEEAPAPEEEGPATSDTVLDDRIFEQATETNDLEKCDEILDEARKEECQQVVKSSLLTGQAVEAKDASLCDDIELDRYKENCENAIENVITDEEAEEKAIAEKAEEETERQETEQQAIEAGNSDICDSIEEENQKYSCRYNVLANQAMSKNDPSLCDEIGDEVFASECKANIDTSEEN